MKRLAIIGAGGHGKVAADIAELSGWDVIVFFDDYPTKNYPWPIIGSCQELISSSLKDYDAIFVAIGNNDYRKKLFNILEVIDSNKLISLIHPKATISKHAQINVGCLIAANAVINPSTVVHKGCIINTGATVDHDCTIQDFSHIAPGVHLSGNVKIGHNNWIGVGSTIIQCIEMADNIFLGGGSLVVKDLKKSGIYYGSPAIFQKELKG